MVYSQYRQQPQCQVHLEHLVLLDRLVRLEEMAEMGGTARMLLMTICRATEEEPEFAANRLVAYTSHRVLAPLAPLEVLRRRLCH